MLTYKSYKFELKVSSLIGCVRQYKLKTIFVRFRSYP